MPTHTTASPSIPLTGSLRFASIRRALSRGRALNFSKHLQRVRDVGVGLKKAFAVGPPQEPLNPEDDALLQRMATVVVRRGMARPTVLFLETLGPMNFLGSQALHFLKPIIDLVCEARELEQAARLLERRDALPRLIELIEAKEDQPAGG